MSWKRRWPARIPLPKVRPLSDEEKEHILGIFRQGIQASPVLTALGIRVRALRGRFYFERVWQLPGEQSEVEVIARTTPLENAKESLVLEAEKRKASWYQVMQGTAKEVVGALAGDTKGTFHGLGALDASLRKTGGNLDRLEVEMLEGLRFVYTSTGQECTAQEALFHFFGVSIDVLTEPRQWYIYHRQPQIVEASQDRTRVLVLFTAYGAYGPFGGTCLYAIVDDHWGAFPVKPNQSQDIVTAVAWLEKRGWEAWPQ
jgi:hypothetical protein